MADRRAREYGTCAAILAQDHEINGAESVFDHALNNGMVAIVAHEWPGQEVAKDGRTKFARDLLKLVQRQAKEVEPGVFALKTRTVGYIPPGSGPSGRISLTVPSTEFVQIQVGALLDAINLAGPIRHGRAQATGALEQRHIEALCELDHHPALGSISEGHRDKSFRDAKIQDLQLRAHALDHLEMIGDEEADRRSSLSDNYLPADPKERLTGPELQECPVCLRESFIAVRCDSYGNGVGVGRCLVCSYERTEVIADDEAADIEWEQRWKDL